MANRAFSVSVSFGGQDQAFFDNWEAESCRLLRLVATHIETGALLPGETATLRDLNGNQIGQAWIDQGDRTDYRHYPNSGR